jgi:hypothetical protein
MRKFIIIAASFGIAVILLTLALSVNPAPVVQADAAETVLWDHTRCAETKEALQTDIAAILSATPTDTPTATATATATPRAQVEFSSGQTSCNNNSISSRVEVNNVVDTLLPATMLYFAVDGEVVETRNVTPMGYGGAAYTFNISVTNAVHELSAFLMDAGGGNIVYDTAYTSTCASALPFAFSCELTATVDYSTGVLALEHFLESAGDDPPGQIIIDEPRLIVDAVEINGDWNGRVIWANGGRQWGFTTAEDWTFNDNITLTADLLIGEHTLLWRAAIDHPEWHTSGNYVECTTRFGQPVNIYDYHVDSAGNIYREERTYTIGERGQGILQLFGCVPSLIMAIIAFFLFIAVIVPWYRRRD